MHLFYILEWVVVKYPFACQACENLAYKEDYRYVDCVCFELRYMNLFFWKQMQKYSN